MYHSGKTDDLRTIDFVDMSRWKRPDHPFPSTSIRYLYCVRQGSMSMHHTCCGGLTHLVAVIEALCWGELDFLPHDLAGLVVTLERRPCETRVLIQTSASKSGQRKKRVSASHVECIELSEGGVEFFRPTQLAQENASVAFFRM